MQQINLYLPELRPKKEWLTANTLVLCILGALALAVIFSYLGRLSNDKLEQSVAELENLKSLANAQVKNIKSMANPRNVADINKKINSLRKLIIEKEKLGQIIEYQNLGNAEGFSSAMEALAVHSKNSFSLSRISFFEGGRTLRLKGETFQPKDIASYIENLSDDPVFAQTQFGALSLNKLDNHPSFHGFTLGDNTTLQMAAEGSACRGSYCNEY